jgi:hypothetical protein
MIEVITTMVETELTFHKERQQQHQSKHPRIFSWVSFLVKLVEHLAQINFSEGE